MAYNKIINKYAIIDIATLTEEQAKTWFIQELNITEKTANQIVKRVGTRFYNIKFISQNLKSIRKYFAHLPNQTFLSLQPV